jgi:hypothetical protein
MAAAALAVAARADAQVDAYKDHWCDRALRIDHCDNFRVTETGVGIRVHYGPDTLFSLGIATWEYGLLHNWYVPGFGYQASGISVFAQMSDYTNGFGAHLRQRWWLRNDNSVDLSAGYLIAHARLSPLYTAGLSLGLALNHHDNAVTSTFAFSHGNRTAKMSPRVYLGGRLGGRAGWMSGAISAFAIGLGYTMCLAVCENKP